MVGGGSGRGCGGGPTGRATTPAETAGCQREAVRTTYPLNVRKNVRFYCGRVLLLYNNTGPRYEYPRDRTLRLLWGEKKKPLFLVARGFVFYAAVCPSGAGALARRIRVTAARCLRSVLRRSYTGVASRYYNARHWIPGFGDRRRRRRSSGPRSHGPGTENAAARSATIFRYGRYDNRITVIVRPT